MNKTAIVIGATGLIGSHILSLLLKDDRYKTIKVFHRRSTGINHPKLEEKIIDFDEMEDWRKSIQGDELFSALGTTIKKAGSKDIQYKIDYTYQYEVAKAAKENGIKKYLLVSSAGANHKSANFYSRIKGELDKDILELDFSQSFIFRPSLLVGERTESRIGEKIGFIILQPLSKLPFIKKYKPIKGETVAKAMIHIANSKENKNQIFELDNIFKILEH